ncbi:MAG: DUF4097 family beta strand repeat-containing protein [bacterium]|nr:DUF4097 family beta strand repeat-containing protein [bacterium]
MEEERLLILKMLEEGKITAEEAAQLFAALGEDPGRGDAGGRPWPRLGYHFRWRLEDMVGRLARPPGGELFSLEEVVTGRFDPGLRPRLRLLTANGRIAVMAADGPEYRVAITKEIRAASREEAEAQAADLVRVARDGRTLAVDAGHSRRRRRWHGATVSIEARLPREAVYAATFLSANGQVEVDGLEFSELRAATVNGTVRLEGVEADGISCRTANGSIHVAGLAANLRAGTVNGSLEVHPRPRGPEARVRLHTVNGPIRLSLPDGAHCELEASTVAGRIHLEGPVLETVAQERGLVGRKLKVRSKGGGPLLEIRAVTVSGSIRVTAQREGADS